jgi:uncharacterized membrane protein
MPWECGPAPYIPNSILQVHLVLAYRLPAHCGEDHPMAHNSLARLAEIRSHHPLRNTYAEIKASMGKLDKIAIWITDHVGTMTFFLLILMWTIFWLGWNLLAPPSLQFDPPMGFVFWLFISNLIQIMLMPLLMIGQNIQGRQSEARAEHDLEVNIKAEAEIETVLHHLERQNEILMAMVEKQGIKLDEVLKANQP